MRPFPEDHETVKTTFPHRPPPAMTAICALPSLAIVRHSGLRTKLAANFGSRAAQRPAGRHSSRHESQPICYPDVDAGDDGRVDGDDAVSWRSGVA